MEDEEDMFALYGENIEEVFASEEGAPDALESLTIGAGQLFSATQAVEELEKPSQGSARASSPPSSWAREMEEAGLASQEGVQEGPGNQGLHHSSVEVSLGDTSRGGVELVSPQP